MINKGEILVVEGGGFTDRAVWGELMSLSSIHIGLGGVVIDGAVRDLGDLKKMNLPIFASGRTAAGPTKGGGGKLDIPISCGNVSLKPGDIIIGDDDGVAVIPFEIQNQILLSSEEKIISSQPSSNAEFIDITLPSNDVDLIEHLFHLISSTIIETTGLVLGVIFVA